MSLGYDNLTTHDFTSYFLGCIAFQCSPEGVVTPHYITSIDSENCGNDAINASAYLSEARIGPRPEPISVPISELVGSRAWLLHRFPVQYITPDGQRLIAIQVEPRDRRMLKGTNLAYLNSNCPILMTLGSDVPAGIRRVLGAQAGMTARMRLVGYPQNEIARALAKVLSYGKHPYFRGVARGPYRNCYADCVSMLSGGEDSVVVPDSHTALVRRGNGTSAIVLHNSAYIGVLSIEEESNTLVLSTSHHTAYTTRADRELIKKGLESAMLRMIGPKLKVIFNDNS